MQKSSAIRCRSDKIPGVKVTYDAEESRQVHLETENGLLTLKTLEEAIDVVREFLAALEMIDQEVDV